MARNGKRKASSSGPGKRRRTAGFGRRRVTRRRLTGMYQKSNVNLGLGLPKIVKMKHRYSQTVRIVSSSGVPSFQRFRANGMYDPDQTGVGHQPMFYDQMVGFWSHWTVIGAKITVTFIPTASTTVPQYVGIMADDDTTTSLNINTIQEQSDTRHRAIAFNNTRPTTVTHKFSAKKVYGPSIMGNNRLQGDMNADPTELFFFTIYNAPIDGSTSVGVDAIVTIDYIAVWTEQKDTDGS